MQSFAAFVGDRSFVRHKNLKVQKGRQMNGKNPNRSVTHWLVAGSLLVVGVAASAGAIGHRCAQAGMDSCCAAAPTAAPTPFEASVLSPVAAIADKARPAQAQVDAVVKSYLAVETLLAADKIDGVQGELKTLHGAAAALVEKAADEKLKREATAVAKAAEAAPKDLKDARAAFKAISAAVIRLADLTPPSADAAPALYEATCPMAKAEWLQTSKQISNPYMGKAMPDCGTIKRQVSGAPVAKDSK